jgi:phage-related minor tail protein
MAEMIGGSLTDNFSSAIANVVTGAQGFGKAFASMAKSILGDIARMIARMIALRAVMALIPGFGQASVLGLSIPGRAQGGPVQSGHAYMVGERGPELFVPRSSGAVVPSGRTQGAQQDSSVAQVADAIMARIGPPPRLVTPEGMAADRFWRAAFAAMVEIAKHDGVRFA